MDTAFHQSTKKSLKLGSTKNNLKDIKTLTKNNTMQLLLPNEKSTNELPKTPRYTNTNKGILMREFFKKQLVSSKNLDAENLTLQKGLDKFLNRKSKSKSKKEDEIEVSSSQKSKSFQSTSTGIGSLGEEDTIQCLDFQFEITDLSEFTEDALPSRNNSTTTAIGEMKTVGINLLDSNNKLVIDLNSNDITSNNNYTSHKPEKNDIIEERNVPETYEEYILSSLKTITEFSNEINIGLMEDSRKSLVELIVKDEHYRSKCINLQGIKNNNNSNNSNNINDLPSNSKDIMILDLDETLIHSEFPMSQNTNYSTVISGYNIGINVRPGLNNFLSNLSKNYNLVLYSAGERLYVEASLEALNIKNFFYIILTKQETFNIPNTEYYIKDTDLVMELDRIIFQEGQNQENQKEKAFVTINSSLETVEDKREAIIIDNSIFSFAFDLSKGILISDYTGNANDEELQDVLEFIEEFRQAKAELGLSYNEQLENHFCFKSIFLAINTDN